jgi:hypothetical protein
VQITSRKRLLFVFSTHGFIQRRSASPVAELYEGESSWEQMQAFVAEKLEEARKGGAR